MPRGVYKRKPFSETHKKNLSESKIGNKCALGKKLSEETKKKMSESTMGQIS